MDNSSRIRIGEGLYITLNHRHARQAPGFDDETSLRRAESWLRRNHKSHKNYQMVELWVQTKEGQMAKARERQRRRSEQEAFEPEVLKVGRKIKKSGVRIAPAALREALYKANKIEDAD